MLACLDTGSMTKQGRSKTNRGPWSRTGTIPVPWQHLGAILVKMHEAFHFLSESLSFFEVMFGSQYASPCCISLHFSFDWTSHLTSPERPSIGDCLTVAHQLLLDRTCINLTAHIFLGFSLFSLLQRMNTYLHKHCSYRDILPLNPVCVESVWAVFLLLSEWDIHL